MMEDAGPQPVVPCGTSRVASGSVAGFAAGKQRGLRQAAVSDDPIGAAFSFGARAGRRNIQFPLKRENVL